MLQEYKIKIPTVIQLSTIEDLVKEFSPVVESCLKKQQFNIVIDLSELYFITPTGLSALRAIITYIARSEYKINGEIIFPQSSVHGYLIRMDFYSFLKNPIQYQGIRSTSSGKFCELIEVSEEKDSDKVATDLAKILQKQLNLNHQAYISIQHILSELICNVFHHANSPINAIVCAQTYPNLRKLEFSIVDCGRGFKESLSQNNIKVTVENVQDALTLAIKPKVTGRPNYNAGEGLFFTIELVKQNQGEMIIYSEDGLLYHQDNILSLKSAPYWKGSIVSISLDLNKPINITELFNQYAPPENDFKFLSELME